MTFILWDILVPGRLVKRREAFKILDQALDDTLTQFQLPLKPPSLVGLSEMDFRELVEVMSAKLAPYNSTFSGEDIVEAIRDRGYGIKAPEIKAPAPKPKMKIPIWYLIGAGVALALMKSKVRKEARR